MCFRPSRSARRASLCECHVIMRMSFEMTKPHFCSRNEVLEQRLLFSCRTALQPLESGPRTRELETLLTSKSLRTSRYGHVLQKSRFNTTRKQLLPVLTSVAPLSCGSVARSGNIHHSPCFWLCWFPFLFCDNRFIVDFFRASKYMM